MSIIIDYLELGLGKLFPLQSPNPHDLRLFKTRPAFSELKEPTIAVTCSEVGEDNMMLKQHSQENPDIPSGTFPALSWSLHPEASGEKAIASYILVVEDPDGPLPTPALHGIFYDIPASKTSVSQADFERADAASNLLSGGFKFGKNLRGTVYGGPKPLLNHGPHRYVYTVVALDKNLDAKALPVKPSRDEIAKAIEGSVVGWGEWIGTYERKWE